MKLNNKFWIFAAVCVAFTSLIFISLGVIFWHQISPDEKTLLFTIIQQQFWYFFSAAFLFMAVFGFTLDWFFRFYILPINQIAEQTKLINSVNPSLRINVDGSRDVMNLAELINQSADDYEALKRTFDKKVDDAKSETESEKNILATIISELPQGVLICNADGSILLYNRQAPQLLGNVCKSQENIIESKGFVGLGRSVYNVIDKNLIEHALGEIHAKIAGNENNIASYFVVVTKERTLLRAEAVPILDFKKQYTGFILIFNDITRQLERDSNQNNRMRVLSGKLRASVAGIKTAGELISQFPDMDEKQNARFISIISKETDIVNELLDAAQLEESGRLRTKWPLVPMLAKDLLSAFKKQAKEIENVDVIIGDCHPEAMVKVDNFSFVYAMTFVAKQLNSVSEATKYSCSLDKNDDLINIDIKWDGKPVKIEIIRKWDDMILSFGDRSISLTLKEIMGHHGAEIWPYSQKLSEVESCVRIYLPALNEEETDGQVRSLTILPKGRPEFYDFNLFSQDGQNPEIDNMLLTDLAYTVFDTETTGLDPRGGDEILSIGAIRIINQRLLKDEFIDQLIDPKREIPYESIQYHGIKSEMVKNKPDINEVLPLFCNFIEETVLIGHNVAFDMKMFQMKEKSTGIKIINPVLDTMLLSAVVNPSHTDHSLSAISKMLGVKIINRHSALGDAAATGEIFLKLIPLLAEKGIRTLSHARVESEKTYFARLKY